MTEPAGRFLEVGGERVHVVERGVVSLSEVGFLILDEADRMLDMGFEVFFLLVFCGIQCLKFYL